MSAECASEHSGMYADCSPFISVYDCALAPIHVRPC